VIDVRDLGRRFDDVVAVDGLTFSVRRGELFGLVGPDGAGKTTTLRMLAGVLRPTTGDATINGVSVARDPEGVKPFIAYMAQRFGLYADLTVRENIEFYADLFGVPRAERSRRLDRLYSFSNLGPFESRLAGKLSGGMQQKLSLCCALIHQPQVLLLDEPTFGVDPISRRDLWLILHSMVHEGVTAVVSTAYLDEAERFDRVALLDQGRFVALDQPAALQASYRRSLLEVRVDRPREAATVLVHTPGVAAAVRFGEAIHVTLERDDADGNAVRERLEAAGHRVYQARPIGPSLEDVFLALTRAETSR